MAFHWRADDGPLLVVFGSSHPHFLKKTLSEMDPLWQNVPDPRMDIISDRGNTKVRSFIVK